jgi:hypothetical protein
MSAEVITQKEKRRLYKQKWYQENKERIATQRKAYRDKNKKVIVKLDFSKPCDCPLKTDFDRALAHILW